MTIGFNTLLYMSFVNAIFRHHFIEKGLIKDWFIDSNLDSFGNVFLRLIDIKPFMLLDLFYAKAKFRIWY